MSRRKTIMPKTKTTKTTKTETGTKLFNFVDVSNGATPYHVDIAMTLTPHMVEFTAQYSYEVNGKNIPIGESYYITLHNSEDDRKITQDADDLPDNFKSAVFDVWGETATVANNRMMCDPASPEEIPTDVPEPEALDG
jgi:hypothetical protein